jgi:hypothetical protein
MQVLKKNLVSIIFAVIAIVAVVAVFWPIGGWYDDLQKQLDRRAAVGAQLTSLASGSRQMPILSPDQTTPDQLTVFPAQDVINAGVAATSQVATQATAMVDTAVKANRHGDLLFPNCLPKPDDSTRFSFAQKYQDATTDYARWQPILNSGARPTPDEISAALAALQDEINKDKLTYLNGPSDANGNKPVNPASVQDAKDEFDARAPEVKPRMEQSAATKYSVYLEPRSGALSFDQSINVKEAPDADKIFDAQLAIWIIDDVAHAIARCNQLYSDPETPGGPPRTDVLHGPIKRIDLIGNPQAVLGASTDAAGGNGTATPKVTTVSASGRVCNALYDVVDFKVDLTVDAAKIPQIVREFEVGQFITVNNVQIIEVVDPALSASQGYRFGDKPVVRIELDCEELLLRQWTNDILPDDKKNGIGSGIPTNAPEGMQGMPEGMPEGMMPPERMPHGPPMMPPSRER